MSPAVLPRFTLRLLVPALALSAIVLLGEPLPAPAQANPSLVVVEVDAEGRLAASLQREADLLRQEAEAAKKAARDSAAAQMRWFLTLPAAGRRCSSPGCTS